MNELRFVRREDLALIVANETNVEFRLIVDDTVLSELRHLSKRDRQTGRVRPREIQALIRAGKSRAQVAETTGLKEADIERFEEPVLAERRYILELAQAVAVRTDTNDDSDQRFGGVIAERLVGLGVEESAWSSWKDEETGWMVGLDFVTHDVPHRAIWGFAHRKGTLSPINPDAVNLSKLGEVGVRLIPKLRAVDSEDKTGRFDSGAFDHSLISAATDLSQPQSEGHPSVNGVNADEPLDAGPPTPSLADANAEYERRREIDHRAVKTDHSEEIDLSQTADLLDALRKRRGEREQTVQPSDTAQHDADAGDTHREDSQNQGIDAAAAPQSIDGTSRPVDHQTIAEGATAPSAAEPKNIRPLVENAPRVRATSKAPSPAERGESEKAARKGRTSIPSWDDILFGTRSDEDPA